MEQHKTAIYALLPTMAGANYELLVQALDEMKEYYSEQSHRFAEHLLWFDTLLKRTDTVSQKDKERLQEKMADYEHLLDESPFVQKRRAEGKVEGLQDAVVTVIESRFPPLGASVKQKISHVQQPDMLQVLLKAAVTAPDEKTLQTMIDLLAA